MPPWVDKGSWNNCAVLVFANVP